MAWTKKDFEKQVQELTGDEYKVIGCYVNTKTKVKMKHEKCGYEYLVQPRYFKSGNRCPKCGGAIRYDTESFGVIVDEMTNGEYKLVGEYKGARIKVNMLHKKCGFEWLIKPNDFKSNKVRCPKCGGRRRINTEEAKEVMYDIVGDEYKMLGDYKNSQIPILMEHTTCGYRWSVGFSRFVRAGSRCPKCAGVLKLNTAIYKERVKKIVGNEYVVLGEYENSQTHIKMEHKICGHEWKVVPIAFVRGSRCPKCNESKGEKAVNSYLERIGLTFEKEFKIEECRNLQPLPFDFAIFQKGELLCLIEYQGEQHYRPIEMWGGNETLKGVRKRDSIKRQYCRKNKIPLIEIRYTEKDIEGYLADALSQIMGDQLKLTI